MAGMALCSHCSLPLPGRPIEDETDGQRLAFCCVGCRTVFRIVGRRGGESGWYLAKLGLAVILSGSIMMFQLLLYLDSYRDLGTDILRTTSWIMLGLSAATYLLVGLPMLLSAWAEARRGRIGLDLLISLGSLAVILASARETIRGTYRTYYDSGTMILVLVTLGSYLDAKSREKATRAIRATAVSMRRPARVRHGDEEIEVAPESVAVGDLVAVRAGEEIPTDGIVTEGLSDVEEAAFSGEPLPRRVVAGDRVFAGSVALDGALWIESSGVSEALAERLRRLAEEARGRRAPIAIAADRASTVFIPIVLAIALATLLIRGLVLHQWTVGGLSALAVLVVACPCALGLATPLATTIALSRLAASGTLVRGGRALETLAKVRLAVFDKTGTLTLGRPLVESDDLSAEDFGAAAAVERGVSHPLATAIVAEAGRRGVTVPRAREVVAVAGGGAQGTVGDVRYRIGSSSWIESHGVLLPQGEQQPAHSVWVMAGERLAGNFRFTDPVRREAAAALADLRRAGIATVLLSGSRHEDARAGGREAGFDVVWGGQSPAAKAAWIEEARRSGRGPVAMIGDGVNDAVALSAADVGIAFGGAADLSRERADISILRDDLVQVANLFVLARRTLVTVKVNLLWAFGYNLAGVALAAFGLLTPVVAASAMVLSSLFVVGNSMRLQSCRLTAPRQNPS